MQAARLSKRFPSGSLLNPSRAAFDGALTIRPSGLATGVTGSHAAKIGELATALCRKSPICMTLTQGDIMRLTKSISFLMTCGPSA